jgi:hypothetical protein
MLAVPALPILLPAPSLGVSIIAKPATSGFSTFETSGDVRREFAFRGKAEDMGSQRVFRLLTQSDIGPGRTAGHDIAMMDI